MYHNNQEMIRELESNRPIEKLVTFSEVEKHKWLVENMTESNIEINCHTKDQGLIYLILIIKNGNQIPVLELRQQFLEYFGNRKSGYKNELKAIKAILTKYKPNSPQYRKKAEYFRWNIKQTILRFYNKHKEFEFLNSHVIYDNLTYKFRQIDNSCKLQCKINYLGE
jgi:hypothetical protein